MYNVTKNMAWLRREKCRALSSRYRATLSQSTGSFARVLSRNFNNEAFQLSRRPVARHFGSMLAIRMFIGVAYQNQYFLRERNPRNCNNPHKRVKIILEKVCARKQAMRDVK